MRVAAPRHRSPVVTPRHLAIACALIDPDDAAIIHYSAVEADEVLDMITTGLISLDNDSLQQQVQKVIDSPHITDVETQIIADISYGEDMSKFDPRLVQSAMSKRRDISSNNFAEMPAQPAVVPDLARPQGDELTQHPAKRRWGMPEDTADLPAADTENTTVCITDVIPLRGHPSAYPSDPDATTSARVISNAHAAAQPSCTVDKNHTIRTANSIDTQIPSVIHAPGDSSRLIAEHADVRLRHPAVTSTYGSRLAHPRECGNIQRPIKPKPPADESYCCMQ